MPTSVRLDARTRALLARLARERQVSKSDVVREAIAAYGAEPAGAPATPFTLLRHLLGRHPSGRGDLSQDTGDQVARLLQERRQDEARRR